MVRLLSITMQPMTFKVPLQYTLRVLLLPSPAPISELNGLEKSVHKSFVNRPKTLDCGCTLVLGEVMYSSLRGCSGRF